VTISDISTTKFIWHLDGWNDTVFYCAWGSYVAALDPSSTSATPTSTSSLQPSPKTNLGVIVGSISGGGLVAIAVLIVLYLLCRRRRRFSNSIRDEMFVVDDPIMRTAAPPPTVLPYVVDTRPRELVSSSTIHLVTPGSMAKHRYRPLVLSNNEDENANASTRTTPAPIITQHVDSGVRTGRGFYR